MLHHQTIATYSGDRSPRPLIGNLPKPIQCVPRLALGVALAGMVSAQGCWQDATPPAAEPEVAAADISDGNEILEGPAGPTEPKAAPDLAASRLVITGTTVLTDFALGASGVWEAMVLEESTVVIQDGRVSGIVPAANFVLLQSDVVVTGRGRFVMAAPLIVGGGGPAEIGAWLEGGRMIDALLSGIGGVIVPKKMVDSPDGRCLTARTKDREIAASDLLPFTGEDTTLADDLITIPTSGRLIDVYASVLRDRVNAGEDHIGLLATLTRAPAAAIGRPNLGVVKKGSPTKLLVLDSNPIDDPRAVLEPFAVVVGDRILRRAELLVLREASVRGADMRQQIAAEQPEGEWSPPLRRWLNSTQGQVYGGSVAAGEGGQQDFATRTGRPRFDRTVGSIVTEPAEGRPNLDLTYTGPPDSFHLTTTPDEDGLRVDLQIVDRPRMTPNSPGPNGVPIVDLALDLDVRRDAMMASTGVFEFDAQELLYGSGPIGLGPRRFRFTPIDVESCPPCFEGFERVWNLEIFDLDAAQPKLVGIATVAFRAGGPARVRFEVGIDPIWLDETPAVGRAPLN
jgi:hypothetical protein